MQYKPIGSGDEPIYIWSLRENCSKYVTICIVYLEQIEHTLKYTSTQNTSIDLITDGKVLCKPKTASTCAYEINIVKDISSLPQS